jgi:hypothetical protein
MTQIDTVPCRPIGVAPKPYLERMMTVVVNNLHPQEKVAGGGAP